MINGFKVITLCGSTKFKEAFIQTQKRLTLEGHIVISVGVFGHSGDTEVWTDDTKEMLDRMHKAKIDLADEIYVIDFNGYIGANTQSEIEYAQSKGLKISYLSQWYKDHADAKLDRRSTSELERLLKNTDFSEAGYQVFEVFEHLVSLYGIEPVFQSMAEMVQTNSEKWNLRVGIFYLLSHLDELEIYDGLIIDQAFKLALLCKDEKDREVMDAFIDCLESLNHPLSISTLKELDVSLMPGYIRKYRDEVVSELEADQERQQHQLEGVGMTLGKLLDEIERKKLTQGRSIKQIILMDEFDENLEIMTYGNVYDISTYKDWSVIECNCKELDPKESGVLVTIKLVKPEIS